jgi:hypothetical protein
MIGKGEKHKLDESDKVLLRALCWVNNTMLLLPISGDKPILLLETQGSKDIKIRSKMKEK